MNLKQTIRSNKVAVIIGLIALAIILWLIFRPVRIDGDNKLKEYLQLQNDSLRSEIQKEQELRAQESQRIDSILTIIENTDFKIIRSKEYHERIIHHYDTASIKQLEKFFQSRYDSQNK